MRRDRIAALLVDAARGAEFPDTPPLAERVRSRIEAGPLPVAEIRLPRTRPPLLRPVLAAVVVLVLVVGLTLSLSVSARRAVADWLGVVGIRVTFGEAPEATPRPAGEVPLGTPVSRAEASELVGFEVLVPAGVRGRAALYFEPGIGDAGMVSVVYPRRARTFADVDLLVSQFTASLPAEYVKKLGAGGSHISYVPVRESDGFWIDGEPHLFFYEDGEGDGRHETVRLAGNVLLWEEDGTTYRIEGPGSLQEALIVASRLR